MKTTAKHLALFERECQKWVDKFGLKGWDLCFDHIDTTNTDQNFAIEWNLEGRCATLALHKNVSETPSDNAMKKIAFHVAGHLFLSRLEELATSRFVTQNEIKEEIEAIIRTLENVML